MANFQSPTPPVTDNIGNSNERANGTAVLRIDYSDGSPDVLTVGCHGPGAPRGIFEGKSGSETAVSEKKRGRPVRPSSHYALDVTRCCNARGCDQFFSPRFARRAAHRYRRRGLDKTARRMVEFLEQRGIEGASVLEVGGGIGEIQIELLKRGAAHAVNLELSPAYDEEASSLLRETGLEHKVERRIQDIAVDPSAVQAADVVVLHRVVCCYPDNERLLQAVAAHSRRLLVFSYPPRNVISRLVVATQNLVFRLQRKEFRTFAHPPPAMLATLGEHGLRPAFTHHGLVWQAAGLER